MTSQLQRSLLVALSLVSPAHALADWPGWTSVGAALKTNTFPFVGSNAEAINSNENYYDGDFGDLDGDGLPDRVLGSRYGLLLNTGGGEMEPFAGRTGFLMRGMSGAADWGEDAFQTLDVDNDGDLDVISGGNFEPFVLQKNRAGHFSTAASMTGHGTSAIAFTLTDVERDGDVDVLVTDGAFFARNIGLFINDGSGTFTEDAAARGLGCLDGKALEGAVSGDVDNDGDFDLVIASNESATNGVERVFYVARNDGSGDFATCSGATPTAASKIHFATPVTNSIGVSVFFQGLNLGDIDGDGYLDLVTSSFNATAGSHPDVANNIFMNDGSGGFTDASATRWDVGNFDPATRFPYVAACSCAKIVSESGKLLDVDYDGDLDFVSFTRDSGDISTFINDNGILRYDNQSAYSPSFTPVTANTGAELDVTDLDRDGDYDLWLGMASTNVAIYRNGYVPADGLPPNLPRNLTVLSATAAGVALRWQAPPFADVARAYRVYRSTSPGLEDRDHRRIKYVGMSRHGDESFAAAITPFTTTALLGDPDVTIDGTSQTVTFVDPSAVPGVRYYYTVSHVGTENAESVQTPEVSALIPRAAGTDMRPPEVDIVSPTSQEWQPFPRIVVHLADDASGVDTSTLSVSLDRAVGALAAGTNLRDYGDRSDATTWIMHLVPPNQVPAGVTTTLTVSVSDKDGNATSSSVSFAALQPSTSPPTAVLGLTPGATGDAPFTVSFDGKSSTDDDRLARWEWYFGDGQTAIGALAQHTYVSAGTYLAELVVRDGQGNVGRATQQIIVAGGAPVCTSGDTRACYTGPGGTLGVGNCVGGTEACVGGQWGACSGEITPQAELCDGVDNDCDNETDEIWPQLGGACTSGLGSCAGAGVSVCALGGAGVVCSASGGAASPETCDGVLDEDCDGTVDDGCPCSVGDTRPCYNGALGTEGVGECHGGTIACLHGAWGTCTDEVAPVAEVCGDALDHDCDGLIGALDMADCGGDAPDEGGAGSGQPRGSSVTAVGCASTHPSGEWLALLVAVWLAWARRSPRRG